jgi:hypothetical protein
MYYILILYIIYLKKNILYDILRESLARILWEKSLQVEALKGHEHS